MLNDCSISKACVIKCASVCCNTAQHQLGEQELKAVEQRVSAAVAAAVWWITSKSPLISKPLCGETGKRKSSPPSGQCPSYLSSASAQDLPSPWQTSPPLWLLCLLSAATLAPCCGPAGPTENKDSVITTNRRIC